MNGYCHLALAIGQNVVTAANADNLEAIALQRLDDLLAVHALIIS